MKIFWKLGAVKKFDWTVLNKIECDLTINESRIFVSVGDQVRDAAGTVWYPSAIYGWSILITITLTPLTAMVSYRARNNWAH